MINSINKPRRYFNAVLTIAACLFAGDATAAIAGIGTDGWHTWRVTASENAPNWCCYEWNGGVSKARSCDLDGKRNTVNSHSEFMTTVDQMQIYVLLESGNVTKIRTVSSRCPVETQAEILDLGVVETDKSVDWLEKSIGPRRRLSSHALAAVAVHDGTKSRDLLIEVARHDADFENRKESVFWMSQVRAGDTAGELKQLMFNDASPEFREHVAFAISRSDIVDRADALIELGRKDQDSDVRSQAWFWLAQTGALESETEIQNALRVEKDQDVRDEVIFALSQLPDVRAYEAMVAVIEDRNLRNEDRQQALFWLAQSESAPTLRR